VALLDWCTLPDLFKFLYVNMVCIFQRLVANIKAKLFHDFV